eukprot:gb/GECG01005673.1/.p1 GENE.gb/GECG01005673.1/~~gb/GECG01005673.1/.p1  ORF type:complete len:609 (+),score=75.49 gb/GECG01005673.1/:1-1827(+)
MEPTATSSNGIRLHWDREQFRRRSSDTRRDPGPSDGGHDSQQATAAARQAGHDMAQAVYHSYRKQQPTSSDGHGIQYSGRRGSPMTGSRSKNHARAPPAPESYRNTNNRTSTRKSGGHRVQEVDSLVQPERSWNDDTRTSGLFDPTIKSKQLFSPKRGRKKSDSSKGDDANTRRRASSSYSKQRDHSARETPPRATPITNRDRRADKPTNPWKRYQEIMGMNKKSQTKRKRPAKQSHKQPTKSGIDHAQDNLKRGVQHVAFEDTQQYPPREHAAESKTFDPQRGQADLPPERAPATGAKTEARARNIRQPSNRIFSHRTEQRKIISIPDVTEHVHHFGIDDPGQFPNDEEYRKEVASGHEPMNHSASNTKRRKAESAPSDGESSKVQTTGERKSKRSRNGKNSADKPDITYTGPASRLSYSVRDSQQLREMLRSLSQAQHEEEEIAARQMQRMEPKGPEVYTSPANTGVPLGVIEGAGELMESQNNPWTNIVTTEPQELSSAVCKSSNTSRDQVSRHIAAGSDGRTSVTSSLPSKQPNLDNIEEMEGYGRKTRKRQQLRYALLEGTGINEFEMHKSLADRLTTRLVRETCEEIDDYINAIAEDTAYAV